MLVVWAILFGLDLGDGRPSLVSVVAAIFVVWDGLRVWGWLHLEDSR
jgi:hypothetical protein